MKRKIRYYMMLCLALFVMVFSLSACGGEGKSEETTEKAEAKDKDDKKKDEEEEEKETTEEEKETEKQDEEMDYASMTENDLVKDFLGQEKLSDEDFVWLTSTYRFVPIDEDLSINYDNITTRAFDLLRDNKVGVVCSSDSLKKLLESEYPQVRAKGYAWTESLLGISDSDKAIVKEAVKTEEDPYVLLAAIRALGNEGGADPEVGAFLLKMAEHENPRVRLQVASWLGSSWNANLEGAMDTMIKLMHDEDEEVAATACGEIGGLGDERAIEPLQEVLNDDAKYEMHGKCIVSLTELWLDYPFHKKNSEAAYKVCMEYYKKTPRSKNVPHWTAVSEPKKIADDTFEAWKTNAPFYNSEEMIGVMTEILQDPEANWLGRTGALDVIKAHGGKEALEAVRPVVEGLTDGDADNIKRSFEEKVNK